MLSVVIWDAIGLVFWIVCLGVMIGYRRKPKVLLAWSAVCLAVGIPSFIGGLPTVWMAPPGILFPVVAFFFDHMGPKKGKDDAAFERAVEESKRQGG